MLAQAAATEHGGDGAGDDEEIREWVAVVVVAVAGWLWLVGSGCMAVAAWQWLLGSGWLVVVAVAVEAGGSGCGSG
jgi:hypothetical protein